MTDCTAASTWRLSIKLLRMESSAATNLNSRAVTALAKEDLWSTTAKAHRNPGAIPLSTIACASSVKESHADSDREGKWAAQIWCPNLVSMLTKVG